MTRRMAIIGLLLFIWLWGSSQNLSVMSFNIRYDNVYDAENNWHNRKAEVAELIQEYGPDFLGIQEALYNQVQYLDSNLMVYKYIGVGRDDGEKAGEFSPVFYDTSKFLLTSQNTFWLSKTPDEVSVGWDASMERICTYGIFKEKNSGKYIYVFNTHFDHIGKKARKKSATLILSKIEEMNIGDSAIILMGDFNSLPVASTIKKINKVLSDPLLNTSITSSGSEGTFNGFDIGIIQNKRIDYIFHKNLEPLNYKHIDKKRENGLFISDHFPVFATFNF